MTEQDKRNIETARRIYSSDEAERWSYPDKLAALWLGKALLSGSEPQQKSTLVRAERAL